MLRKLFALTSLYEEMNIINYKYQKSQTKIHSYLGTLGGNGLIYAVVLSYSPWTTIGHLCETTGLHVQIAYLDTGA